MTAIVAVGLTGSDTINSWRLVTNQMVARFNNLGTYDAISITGGLIDNVQIGSVTPDAGTFTNLTVNATADLSGATLVLADNQINGAKVSGGTITSVMVTLSGTPTLGSHATTKTYVDTAVATISGSLAAYALTSSISAVGLSGAYADLTGKPTLGSLAALSTVSTSNITNSQVTYAKIQDVSAQYSILARTSSGAGPVQELASTAAIHTFLGLSTTALMATNIGVGTGSTVQFSSLGLGVSAPAAGNLIVNKTATFASEISNGSVSSNFNIDWTAGQKQVVTLTGGSLTMTFTNPAGPGHFQLRIVQDGSGSRTITTWPTIKTPGGGASAWALSPAAAAQDLLNLYWNGTSWYGQLTFAWS